MQVTAGLAAIFMLGMAATAVAAVAAGTWGTALVMLVMAAMVVMALVVAATAMAEKAKMGLAPLWVVMVAMPSTHSVVTRPLRMFLSPVATAAEVRVILARAAM